jgi:hypothetical protein
VRFDTGFRPSAHGFGFPNTWRDTIIGVVASRGRCGGMVFLALDHFLAGRQLPAAAAARELPAHDSPLALSVWRRQVDSVLAGLGGNIWSFAALTYLPSHAPLGAAGRSRRDVDPLLAELDDGRSVPLGLIGALSIRHLARNHQVLGYAAERRDGSTLIAVYDPNFPLRDDVVIEVPDDPSGRIVERVGGREIPWRGVFIEAYESAPVPGASVASRRDSRAGLGVGIIVLVALVGVARLLRRRRGTGER